MSRRVGALGVDAWRGGRRGRWRRLEAGGLASACAEDAPSQQTSGVSAHVLRRVTAATRGMARGSAHGIIDVAAGVGAACAAAWTKITTRIRMRMACRGA